MVRDGARRPVIQPYAFADHAVAGGACPLCRAEPFKIAGSGMRPSADDRAYESDGRCLACGGAVGLIRAEASTLFGVREDEAVGSGPWRVY